MELKPEQIEAYLTSLFCQKTSVLGLQVLGETPEDRNVKSYGYGVPVRIDYETASVRRSAVLHTISPGPFGHENMPDRAQILLGQHHAFNRLPNHVRSLDVGGFDSNGSMVSLGDLEELYLLTEYVEGEPYALDLERLGQIAGEQDLARADALCDYLVEIHRERPDPDRPGLYVRRIRELVGHGECVMGLADSFPADTLVTPQVLEEIEKCFVGWRWRLKGLTHRLRSVHGDFHPWNILFGPGTAFRVLDRSRGEFGEPADDVACLTINYLFFSLCRTARLEGAFDQLFRRFWNRYLEKTGDAEMLRVVGPFFAFRGLVLVNPLWYPNLSDTVRHRILAFTLHVLDSGDFDPALVNDYCDA
ncbi:MAG: phosphotransferase [Bryobacteraceae bacterium]